MHPPGDQDVVPVPAREADIWGCHQKPPEVCGKLYAFPVENVESRFPALGEMWKTAEKSPFTALLPVENCGKLCGECGKPTDYYISYIHLFINDFKYYENISEHRN